LLLAILWFVLPFAIFGIKPRLDEIVDELRRTNALLKNLVDERKSPVFKEEAASKEVGGRAEPRL